MGALMEAPSGSARLVKRSLAYVRPTEAPFSWHDLAMAQIRADNVRATSELKAQFETELGQLHAALEDEERVNSELEARLQKAEHQLKSGEDRYADIVSAYRATLVANGGDFLT